MSMIFSFMNEETESQSNEMSIKDQPWPEVAETNKLSHINLKVTVGKLRNTPFFR